MFMSPATRHVRRANQNGMSNPAGSLDGFPHGGCRGISGPFEPELLERLRETPAVFSVQRGRWRRVRALVSMPSMPALPVLFPMEMTSESS